MSSSQHRKVEWTCASLLATLKPSFKDIVLYFFKELLSIPYMDGKLEISSFYPNFNTKNAIYSFRYGSKSTQWSNLADFL
jgi:hypothetical protein